MTSMSASRNISNLMFLVQNDKEEKLVLCHLKFSRKLLQFGRVLSSQGHVAAVELSVFSQVLFCPYDHILCIFHLTVLNIKLFLIAECECYVYNFFLL